MAEEPKEQDWYREDWHKYIRENHGNDKSFSWAVLGNIWSSWSVLWRSLEITGDQRRGGSKASSKEDVWDGGREQRAVSESLNTE